MSYIHNSDNQSNFFLNRRIYIKTKKNIVKAQIQI